MLWGLTNQANRSGRAPGRVDTSQKGSERDRKGLKGCQRGSKGAKAREMERRGAEGSRRARKEAKSRQREPKGVKGAKGSRRSIECVYVCMYVVSKSMFI